MKYAFGCVDKEKISLIRKGKTAYSIFVDLSASAFVEKAADDLKSYFLKVTGASSEIVVTTQFSI